MGVRDAPKSAGGAPASVRVGPAGAQTARDLARPTDACRRSGSLKLDHRHYEWSGYRISAEPCRPADCVTRPARKTAHAPPCAGHGRCEANLRVDGEGADRASVAALALGEGTGFAQNDSDTRYRNPIMSSDRNSVSTTALMISMKKAPTIGTMRKACGAGP
jgi:hypothetical protein